MSTLPSLDIPGYGVVRAEPSVNCEFVRLGTDGHEHSEVVGAICDALGTDRFRSIVLAAYGQSRDHGGIWPAMHRPNAEALRAAVLAVQRALTTPLLNLSTWKAPRHVS